MSVQNNLRETIALYRQQIALLEKNSQRKVLEVMMFERMLELAEAINTLNINNQPSGIPILFRTFLEMSIDHINLHKDSKYGYRLDSNMIKEAKKIHNEQYDTPDNDLKLFYSWALKKEKELTAEKFKTISIEKKFELAGLSGSPYRIIYNQLCAESHNNLRIFYSSLVENKEILAQYCLEGTSYFLQNSFGFLKEFLPKEVV